MKRQALVALGGAQQEVALAQASLVASQQRLVQGSGTSPVVAADLQLCEQLAQAASVAVQEGLKERNQRQRELVERHMQARQADKLVEHETRHATRRERRDEQRAMDDRPKARWLP